MVIGRRGRNISREWGVEKCCREGSTGIYVPLSPERGVLGQPTVLFEKPGLNKREGVPDFLYENASKMKPGEISRSLEIYNLAIGLSAEVDHAMTVIHTAD
jgi:hypothetical protein